MSGGFERTNAYKICLEDECLNYYRSENEDNSNKMLADLAPCFCIRTQEGNVGSRVNKIQDLRCRSEEGMTVSSSPFAGELDHHFDFILTGS